MAYSTIRSGAKGDAVSELQRLLNQNGASLTVDGVFGDRTAAAVRDYQARMGLAVDGIAGTRTWSALTGGGGAAGAAGGSSVYSPTGSSGYGFAESGYGAMPTFAQSEELRRIAEELARTEGAKPGPYQSAYQSQIDALLQKITNREPFQYDFNADPLYQQYKGNYLAMGKTAMQDATANAAALTGGYANSYAATAGNQAYQQYARQVNNVIPQLRDAAYQMYRDQGADLYDRMGLYRGLEGDAYGKYRDQYGDWQADRGYYSDKYGDSYGREYGAYQDQLGQWNADRDYAFQQQQPAQAQANWAAEMALAAQKASGGGSGGGGKKASGATVTDWDALLASADNAQKQAILYGYTAEGKGYMESIRKEIGDDGLDALRRKYGGSAYGGR